MYKVTYQLDLGGGFNLFEKTNLVLLGIEFGTKQVSTKELPKNWQLNVS